MNRTNRTILIAFWLIGVLHVAAWAQNSMPASTQPGSGDSSLVDQPEKPADKDFIDNKDKGSGVLDWAKTLGALALVVVLIFATRWVLSRLGGVSRQTRSQALEVISQRSLTSRHQLCVVRFGKRIVLVGVGPQGLSTLDQISDPGEISELLECSADKAKSKGGTE